MKITEVKANKILDSRGAETIEVAVNGCAASAPSGKSTGKYETPSFHNSIDWNVDFINAMNFDFPIEKFEDLEKVEELIKKQLGFKDAKEFGANALFALESAILKALAVSKKKQLWQVVNARAKKFPRPAGNAIGGGLHSAQFDEHPTFQEFLLIPADKTFEGRVNTMNEVYQKLASIFGATEKNDEGAWQVPMGESEIFEILDRFRDRIDVGIDAASTSFYKNGQYKYKILMSRKQQIDYINLLVEKYKLIYVEDPVEEEDFEGFSMITRKTMVVGDDLTATHLNRLQKAIDNKSISGMIIKPNQNGSLIEVARVFEMCKKNKIKTILSHRSGETMDDALADYAFAFGADFIKCGISTPFRECKLNRMIEIEHSLPRKEEKKDA